MEKSNSKNTKIRDDERERKRESKKKNRQGRRQQDSLTKHGVAHSGARVCLLYNF